MVAYVCYDRRQGKPALRLALLCKCVLSMRVPALRMCMPRVCVCGVCLCKQALRRKPANLGECAGSQRFG
jgi:hypothetical protein